MSKRAQEIVRQNLNAKGLPYTSKALRDECKEMGCNRPRANGSSRCDNHKQPKV